MRWTVVFGLAVTGATISADSLHAQMAGGHPQDRTLQVSDFVRSSRTMHITPDVVVFDEHERTATVMLSNEGDKALTARIETLCAYMDYPRDPVSAAALFRQHWESLMPHDTIISTPGPRDRCANTWVSGLPPQLTLAPKQRKTFTVRISPPPTTADGEYSARIVTVVSPPDPSRNKGKPKDVRTIYQLPVKGNPPPVLRDSVEVLYRKGSVTVGVAVGAGAVAQIDTVGLDGPPDIGDGTYRLWVRLPLRLTGNAHFSGIAHPTLLNIQTREQFTLSPGPILLYHDAVTHWWAMTSHLPPGHYELVIVLDAPQENLPPSKRLPMTPVIIRLPFEKMTKHTS